FANASDYQIHRWQRPRLCGPGISLCMHHHRLRRGLRVSFSNCFWHHAENDHTRIANTQHRLWRDGNGNDGCPDGDDCSVCASTGEYFAINTKGAPTEVV